MADELARLVVDGPKRATVALMAEIEHDNEPIPLEREHWMVADGLGSPVCAVRTVEVEIKPLRDVDPSVAWDEGEGDRTLEWWLEAHRG